MFLVGKGMRQFRWLMRSSTVRLSLLLSFIFAVGMAVSIFVALTLGANALERRVDAALVALAANSDVSEAASLNSTMILRGLDDLRGLPQGFARAVPKGQATIDLPNDFLGSELWRVLVTKDVAGNDILIALPLEESEEARELLGGILWTTTGLIIGLTLAIGLFAGLIAQRRIMRIEATLGDLASGDLSARTGISRNRDDLDQISRRVDQTATELERLVSQTRNLSASIAHDLRTPLARLRSRLEMLPDGEERSAALEEAARLSDIFDTIMRVARIEAMQGKDGFETVDLTDLATDIHEIFEPVVDDSGKKLLIDIQQTPGSIRADRAMIIQAIANLIQNALVHGGANIILSVGRDFIAVIDDGLGVNPIHHAEIVKPMVRLDAARTKDGSGLGLSLVRAVADRHGATLEFTRVDPVGFRVSMNFADL